MEAIDSTLSSRQKSQRYVDIVGDIVSIWRIAASSKISQQVIALVSRDGTTYATTVLSTNTLRRTAVKTASIQRTGVTKSTTLHAWFTSKQQPTSTSVWIK